MSFYDDARAAALEHLDIGGGNPFDDTGEGVVAFREAAERKGVAPGELVPVDLQAVLDGGLELIKPDLFSRNDGQFLLYRNKMNVVFGEPEAGKSWVAIFAVAQLVSEATRAGGSYRVVAVYCDFEDDARSYMTRMRAAGADLDAVVRHVNRRHRHRSRRQRGSTNQTRTPRPDETMNHPPQKG